MMRKGQLILAHAYQSLVQEAVAVVFANAVTRLCRVRLLGLRSSLTFRDYGACRHTRLRPCAVQAAF
jgi:hypothetical protein